MVVAMLCPFRRCELNPSDKYIQAIKVDKKEHYFGNFQGSFTRTILYAFSIPMFKDLKECVI